LFLVHALAQKVRQLEWNSTSVTGIEQDDTIGTVERSEKILACFVLKSRSPSTVFTVLKLGDFRIEGVLDAGCEILRKGGQMGIAGLLPSHTSRSFICDYTARTSSAFQQGLPADSSIRGLP